MRHVLPKMPIESAELLQFFETVEKLYAMYDVPEVVQAKLLFPLLTAQSLVNQMSVDDMSDYTELKQFLTTGSIRSGLRRLSKMPGRRVLCLPLGCVIFCRII